MLQRSMAVAFLRHQEDEKVSHFREKAPHHRQLWTDAVVSREMFAIMAPPPTPHREFLIRTLWEVGADGDVSATSFQVYVYSAGYPWGFKETPLSGEGRFGEG